jgi:hypothetical protein
VNRRWVKVTMVVATTMVLLVAAVGAYAQFGPGRTTYPSRWDPRVVGIVQFVEQERGLKFRHPVAVDFLADEQFKAKVGVGTPPSAKAKVALQHLVGEMRALGLIHGDADLAAMDNQLAQQSVIGLYVPADKRVYVRGAALTPDVRVTLAHELTHALQDQHFDLQRLDHLPNADSSAVRALIEGDAVRVENAYVASLSAADKAAYQQAGQAQVDGANLKGISQVLIDGFSFPYVFGPVFVKALVASGGTAALDHALANPPTVDAQVVDPNRYLIQTDVATVKAPNLAAGDTRLADPAFFGQVSMLQVIGETEGYVAAWSALESWRGDQAVDYLHGGQVCIAIASAFDSPEHATTFAALAQHWATGRDGASVQSADSTVELRACDPGPTATPAPVASPSPFEVLSLRASLLGGLIDQDKAPADVAGCIADEVIRTVGPSAFLGNVPSATDVVVARASAQAAKVCGYAPPPGSTTG